MFAIPFRRLAGSLTPATSFAMLGCAGGRELGEGANPPESSPYQDVFDVPDGWTTVQNDDHYLQRYRLAGDLIFCETRTTVWGKLDDAVRLLRAPWTWYGGAVEHFEAHADGSRTFVLKPAGSAGLVTVDEDMAAPEEDTDASGSRVVRIQIQLDGYGSGLAYIELHCEGPRRFTLLARLAAVRSPVLPTSVFAAKHLEAERGELGVPFFITGGGFEGFKAALARGKGRPQRNRQPI